MKSIAILLLASLGLSAHALPLPKGPRAFVAIPPTFTADYNFEGIIALDDCSGSLVRLENAKDTDTALVFTNGHCLETGMPDPGTAVVHESSSRRLGLMDVSGNVVATLRASEIVYSSMTKTDVTIYKVRGETYASIAQKYNIHPLTLVSQHPAVGQRIEIISGYWHRGYSCSVDAFIFNLREGVYTWDDSLRYSEPGCEVIGGTSGSPVIAAGTRNMIAINNTGNEDGGRCTDNNPCEVDKSGNITFQRGNNYAEETYQIYSCVNANNEIDVTMAGCQLFH